MIRYALSCDQGHVFESWFASSAAYDKQAKRALVTCPVCGSAKAEKAMMAPHLARADVTGPQPPAPPNPAPASTAQTPAPVPEKTPVAMVSAAEHELRQKLSTRVEIRVRGKDKGHIVLSFESNDDFERILEVLNVMPANFELPAPVLPSIGIALCPRDATARSELLGFADTALYCANTGGRFKRCQTQQSFQ